MTRTPTPATLLLLGANISPKSLADELHVTASAVSFQLAGKARQTSPALLGLIAKRGGAELADNVELAIDALREIRRARMVAEKAAEVSA